MSNYYICEIVDYSTEHILKKIKENKIYVLEFKKIDDYLFHIKVDINNYKKLSRVFSNCKVIYTKGIFFILKNRLIQKITIISLVIGIGFYIYLSSLIYKVEINGNNVRITNNIYEILERYNIKKYKKLPNDSDINEVKKIIIDENNEIENVDLKKNGTIIQITYYLKEKEYKHYSEYGKYYAKKEGIISYVDIEAGNFLYSTNDYVKKDDLLIDDYIYVNDKSLYVGGFGKVYAYTWTMVSLSLNTYSYDKLEMYSLLCSKARYSVSKNFVDDEKIESENVLSYQYNENKSSIKIHYTLLENIAILKKN